MSRLPPAPAPGTRQWSLQNEIQNAVIGLFYEALQHPPTIFVPSMQLEMKVPTVLDGDRLGAGGSRTVSEGRIGSIGVPTPTPSAKPLADLQTPTPGPSRLPSGGSEWEAATSPAGIPTTTPTHETGGLSSIHTNGHANPTPPAPQGTIPQRAYSSAFRVPSGAGNNPHMPLLGVAGTPYARSVVPQHPVPRSALPDPGMVFDLLMRRQPPPPGVDPNGPNFNQKLAAEYQAQGHGQPHPSGLSSLLFAFGDLIIHSLFRTSSKDKSINLTSSYLDLSVLYGVDETEMSGVNGVGGVRRHDGTGRLWEDTWADPRIAMMGPAVGALLAIFCRNHNVSNEHSVVFFLLTLSSQYVALRLLEIDEYREYQQPVMKPPRSNHVGADQLFPSVSESDLAKQEHDIFNRARLINCAYFTNAILG